jgi:peptidoglycan/LPS O-acetylase OafA/YrhL
LGFYRYFLAIGVLISHVGGGNWVIARTAVFCFYFVSGFLICRVLDTSYRGGIERVAAFYVNRALRLLPLYLLIVFATFAIFSIRGSASFVRLGDGETVSLLYLDNFSTRLMDLLPLPVFDHSAPIPMLAGASLGVMPQGWSIGIEVAFYVIAPILVLLARRNVWPLVALAVAATAVFRIASFANSDPNYLDNVIYRNAYTSAFMFFWGGAIYVVMRDTRFRIPFIVGAPLVAADLYYYYAWATSAPFATTDVSHDAFIFNILLGIPLSAIVCLTVMPERLRRIESRVGDLSYGIYLNHFMVAGLLMWITEAVGREIFGHYSAIEFGLSTIVASSLVAALTFNLVERPVEILRRKLKGRPGRETVVATAEPAPVPTPAG